MVTDFAKTLLKNDPRLQLASHLVTADELHKLKHSIIEKINGLPDATGEASGARTSLTLALLGSECPFDLYQALHSFTKVCPDDLPAITITLPKVAREIFNKVVDGHHAKN